MHDESQPAPEAPVTAEVVPTSPAPAKPRAVVVVPKKVYPRRANYVPDEGQPFDGGRPPWAPRKANYWPSEPPEQWLADRGLTRAQWDAGARTTADLREVEEDAPTPEGEKLKAPAPKPEPPPSRGGRRARVMR